MAGIARPTHVQPVPVDEHDAEPEGGDGDCKDEEHDDSWGQELGVLAHKATTRLANLQCRSSTGGRGWGSAETPGGGRLRKDVA